MFLSFLTLITALCISGVAIYYSVAGLVAIFASAVIPVIIMGTVLEVGKLVTAVWLHKYWDQSVWWLKTYLSVAVVVLMLVTSMGIFGFLSKAHIEQTFQATESQQQVAQLTTEIARQQAIIDRATAQVTTLESKSSTQDSGIQQQIDLEQSRINNAYARVQPAIDEQNSIIAKEQEAIGKQTKTLEDQLAASNQKTVALDAALAANDVRAAQAIVGVKQDGSMGSGTVRAVESFRSAEAAVAADLTAQIAAIRSTPNSAVDAARAEIARLRSLAEQQIADSNKLIVRLQDQVGKTDSTKIEDQINEQNIKIKQANDTIDQLTQQKIAAETGFRKLEAEVGPVKYIAEFVYGTTADQNLLEQAVRWVIIMIIFVFDPLAVLLLIASQYSFKLSLPEKPTKSVMPVPDPVEKIVAPVETAAPTEEPDANEVDDINLDALSEEEKNRVSEWRKKEKDKTWKVAKTLWKLDNPGQTIKSYRQLFIEGKVDRMPWESYYKSVEEYRQNDEQKEESLFTQIQQRKNDQT